MNKVRIVVGLVGGVVLLVSLCLYYVLGYLMLPPNEFSETEIVIASGDSLQEISNQLESAKVIRSAYALQIVFSLFEDSTQIKAGTFLFTEPRSTRAVAETLVTGQFDTELVEVTFLEGQRVTAYGRTASDNIESFDLEEWDRLTKDFEGRLFPDTYFIPPDYTATQLFTLLRTQHDQVMETLFSQATPTTMSQSEVVILASILEREANSEESMRTVAGIFMNRLDIGMPLQADATIEYVIDTPLNELKPGQLATELRELDSPYNTYLYPGLPPTPIGNPGEQAIQAVLDPLQTEYLYYITGTDGEFYYAETYNQHLLNIERHLQ